MGIGGNGRFTRMHAMDESTVCREGSITSVMLRSESLQAVHNKRSVFFQRVHSAGLSTSTARAQACS